MEQHNNIPYENGYYIYLIRCENDALYCGWTTNLRKRFYAHASGKGARFTRAHRPIELCYFEILENESSARKREYAIKQLNHKEKCQLIKKKGAKED